MKQADGTRILDLIKASRCSLVLCANGDESFPVVRKSQELTVKAEGDEELRDVEIVASTPAVDSFGDVIVQTGWDLKRFKSNPVLLLNHRAIIENVVGKASQIAKNAQALTMLGRLDDSTNEAANQLRSRLENGSVKTVSVGFIPLAFEKILDDAGEWTGGFKFLKQELLEVSFVAIPANIEAIAKPKKTRKGVTDDEFACKVGEMAFRLTAARVLKALGERRLR